MQVLWRRTPKSTGQDTLTRVRAVPSALAQLATKLLPGQEKTLYLFPKDSKETGRLDLQHYMYMAASGSLFSAPIEYPGAVLDVACGTGIWGRHMAQKYPKAEVWGIDNIPTPYQIASSRAASGHANKNDPWPGNFYFHQADALAFDHTLPYLQYDQYDLVYMRLGETFIPKEAWIQLVREMRLMARKGGFVEIVECDTPECTSPSFNDLSRIFCQVMEVMGMIPSAGPHIKHFMREAGLTVLGCRLIDVGRSRNKRIERSLLIANLLAAYEALQPLVRKHHICSETTYLRLLGQAQRDLKSSKVDVHWPFYDTWGIHLD